MTEENLLDLLLSSYPSPHIGQFASRNWVLPGVLALTSVVAVFKVIEVVVLRCHCPEDQTRWARGIFAKIVLASLNAVCSTLVNHCAVAGNILWPRRPDEA